MFAGIEAGGTKFVCAVGRGPGEIYAQATIPTIQPGLTLQKTIEFLLQCQQEFGPFSAIGIASFGPLDLNADSSTYGFITATTKQGWSNTDIVGTLREAFVSQTDIKIGIETDVNGAALGEWKWGAAQNLENFVYLTVGTGIGGGGMVNGRLLHGLVHPEMGHLRIPHDWQADPFPGVCPFHGDCLEGLATGPAMKKRWGVSAETLSSEHPAWKLEVHYLALGLVNLICSLSPERIIMGGGIGWGAPHIFPLLRQEILTLLGGYVQAPAILKDIDNYLVPPALGSQAGVLGAIALAQTLTLK